MKFIVAFILTILLAYTAFLYSHIIQWWGFAIGAFIVGVAIPQRAWLSWLSSFTGVFICWGTLAWYMNKQNAGLLSAKMAQVLPLNGSSTALMAVTAFVGALVGGFAALSGAYLRNKKTDIPQ